MLVAQSCETAAAEWNFIRYLKHGLTALSPRNKRVHATAQGDGMLRISKVFTLLVVLGLLASFPAVISAQTEHSSTSKMYWTDVGTDRIQRANLDGSDVQNLVTELGGSDPNDGPTNIALDVQSGKMYWVYWRGRNDASGKIQRSNLDGSQVEDIIAGLPGLNKPNGLALDLTAGKLYWTSSLNEDLGGSKIQRANLDGSQVEDLVTSGLSWPRALALDTTAGKMYWTDVRTDKIQRANLDGSQIEDLITTGLTTPNSLALDLAAGKMYWADSDEAKIQRSNLDGSQVEDLITTGLTRPNGLALDLAVGKMYWADRTDGKIHRASLDGSEVEDLVTTGLLNPAAIALDVSGVPEPGPNPGTDECGETLAADDTVSGTWAAGCDSEARSGSHARYYSFTLVESSEVTVRLESSAADTYLYLRSGDATSGSALHENDNHQGSTSASQIVATLAAGTYTIEATTNSAGAIGSFTLTKAVEEILSVIVSHAGGTAVMPGSPVSLEATFKRPVSGFASGDIEVVNGTVSNFAGSGDVYTFDVTQDDIDEVTTVDIAADVAQDADGNGNEAAPRFYLGIPYDDDGDGAVSRVEVIAAIRDYFDGNITRAQAIAVIRLYFSGAG